MGERGKGKEVRGKGGECPVLEKVDTKNGGQPMDIAQGITYRYSLAFRKKVVDEIEGGKITLVDAQKLYNIRGGQTIQKWIKSLGKNHLLNKVVRIEMRDEKDRVKELEKEKRALESALAKAQVKVVFLESLIDVANTHYRTDLKKTFGTKE